MPNDDLLNATGPLSFKTQAGTNKHEACVPMSDHNHKIYVDAAPPATLNDGAGKLTDCATLQEAVMAWHRLRPEQTKRATIKVFGGQVYTATEIVRLHFGPKPE